MKKPDVAEFGRLRAMDTVPFRWWRPVVVVRSSGIGGN